MSATVPVTKDAEKQQPIPTAWRPTLSAIVEAVRANDFRRVGDIPQVAALNERMAASIKGNILEYGAHLVSVPEASWETSCCQWMDGYWDLMVDLFTVEEGASDLVLAVRVRESAASGYLFEVHGVYVP